MSGYRKGRIVVFSICLYFILSILAWIGALTTQFFQAAKCDVFQPICGVVSIPGVSIFAWILLIALGLGGPIIYLVVALVNFAMFIDLDAESAPSKGLRTYLTYATMIIASLLWPIVDTVLLILAFTAVKNIVDAEEEALGA